MKTFSGKKIFFSGIGGSGMSALAVFAADLGASVSGSDRDYDAGSGAAIYGMLLERGIRLLPQDGSGLDPSCDLMVASTAVESANPDIERARSLGINIQPRPEFLAQIIGNRPTIAIAGTNGKSSTSGMLAWVMRELGLDPDFIGGARVKQFRAGGNSGNSLSGGSGPLVVEACESDAAIASYSPEVTVLLNLSFDHRAVSETESLFQSLLNNTRGGIIINGDDERLRRLRTANRLSFGLGPDCGVRATGIGLEGLGSRFRVDDKEFRLAIPGLHNIYNALAVVAVLKDMGIPAEKVAGPLAEFAGLDRRFDIHLNSGDMLVVDDYAHNPDKITALMETLSSARETGILYIFQPHGYGPTRLLRKAYIDTFHRCLRAQDRLMILPIFYAGGTVARDISSEDLSRPLAEAGLDARTAPDRDSLLENLREWKTCVVFGARDESLSGLAADIARQLSAEVASG